MAALISQMLLLTLVSCFSSVYSHSWLTCPPSFSNKIPQRGGHRGSLCEPGAERAFVTTVTAGDRLKVGWTANNHGGGFVRISLVPLGDHQSEAIAKVNILKFVCYGHHIDNTKFGDCVHPCGGRGGCEYQNNTETTEALELYDTTIGIPFNLPEGDYVLQTAMLLGNDGTPYNSCGRLRILDGNPSLDCSSNEPPIVYTCYKAPGGRALEDSDLLAGTKRGDFCFHPDRRGTVDDDIDLPPVNIDCDSRLSCKNSVNQNICGAEPFMNNIVDEDSHPTQPRCKNNRPEQRRGRARPDRQADNANNNRQQNNRQQNNRQQNNRQQVNQQQNNRRTAARVTTTTEVPETTTEVPETTAPEATTSTTITTTTTTTTTTQPPNNNRVSNTRSIVRRRESLNPMFSFYDSPVVQRGPISRNNGLFSFTIVLSRPIPDGFCWQLDLQFRNPIRLLNDEYNVYNDGMLVARNNRRVLTIERRPQRSQAVINRNRVIRVSFTGYREGRRLWSRRNMQFITAMLLVLPEDQCYNRLLRST